MEPKMIYNNYLIFPDGRVYSNLTNKFLKVNIDKLGYNAYVLQVNGKNKRLYIHRLVAINFIENKYNLTDVNHKDSDKSNNNINNLEWISRRDNILYSINFGFRNPLVKKPRQRHNKSSKIILDNQTGIFYESTRYAAEAKNINRGSLICKLSGNVRNNTTLLYV